MCPAPVCVTAASHGPAQGPGMCRRERLREIEGEGGRPLGRVFYPVPTDRGRERERCHHSHHGGRESAAAGGPAARLSAPPDTRRVTGVIACHTVSPRRNSLMTQGNAGGVTLVLLRVTGCRVSVGAAVSHESYLRCHSAVSVTSGVTPPCQELPPVSLRRVRSYLRCHSAVSVSVSRGRPPLTSPPGANVSVTPQCYV